MCPEPVRAGRSWLTAGFGTPKFPVHFSNGQEGGREVGGRQWQLPGAGCGTAGGCSRAALSQHQALESRMCTQEMKLPVPRANRFW